MGYDLLHGKADWTHPFTYRIIPITLLAACYRLFGVNDWASAIPAMTASFCIAWLFYRALRYQAWWVLALAISAYFGMRWNTFYSDKIMADILVSALSLGALVAYLNHRWHGASPIRNAALAALLLFLAYNCKGSVILLAPVFILLLLLDLWRGRSKTFWFTFIGVNTALLLAYLVACYVFFGSALARFQVIEAHRYLNECSYDILPLSHLIERLTTGYWAMLVDSRMVVHLVIAILFLTYLLIRRRLRSREAILPVIAIMVFLSINFMTISFNSYNPVCTDPRHIMLFGPILSLCSALSVASVVESFGLHKKSPWFEMGVISICIALLYPAYQIATYSKTLEYDKVKARYEAALPRLQGPAVVYGTRVTRMISPYILGFKHEEQKLTFVDFRDLPPCNAISTDTTRYILQTWYADWHSKVGSTEIDTTLSNKGYIRKPSEASVTGLDVYLLKCDP
ncbi:hypothetical protein [Lewinella sp. IMCC34191]|uniref:hypothetical protein n=1 Tax=Lewinella sp. IMCC34191 TaxID=2259172 RepID=UPI0018E55FDD|nr:hypothetical protein [Lewinella sp. IMCC34191]